MSVTSDFAILRWRPIREIDVQYGGRVVFRHSPKVYDPNDPTTKPKWGHGDYLGSARGDDDDVIFRLIPGTYMARVIDSASLIAARKSPMLVQRI